MLECHYLGNMQRERKKGLSKMSHRTSMEPVLVTVGNYLSFFDSLFSFLAAILVFASACFGFSAVRTWTSEKRRNATRIMIAVLETQRAINKIRSPFRSTAEYQAAKSDLEVTDDNNPAVLGKIALNRVEDETKRINEIKLCISIASVAFGPKVQKELDGIIHQIDRIVTDAGILMQTEYGSTSADRLFETVAVMKSDDEMSKIVAEHVEAIRKSIGRYLPPNP